MQLGHVTRAAVGGEGEKRPLPRFPYSEKTAAHSAAKFSEPLEASIIHLATKNQGQDHYRSDVSDVTLMTSINDDTV